MATEILLESNMSENKENLECLGVLSCLKFKVHSDTRPFLSGAKILFVLIYYNA